MIFRRGAHAIHGFLSSAMRRDTNAGRYTETIQLLVRPARTSTMTNPTIEQIRKALEEVQQSGQSAVDVAALQRFLESVEGEQPIDPEIRKLNHDS